MNNIPTNKELRLMANKLRIHSINETTKARSGHPTSCMSCAEIMSVLFFSEIKDNDEFILSKGHSAPILWAVYAESGIIPRNELSHLRDIHSVLEGHPTKRMPCTKIATGSLGQGLSAGVGMALGKKLKKYGRVFVLLGDGECAEGSVWEAANAAVNLKLNNLCAIVDVNKLGQSEQTMHGHNIKAYRNKFKAFGWNTVMIDGHNIFDVTAALHRSRKTKKPLAIIARTEKGKGYTEVEGKQGFHGKPFSLEESKKVIDEIGFTDIKLKSHIKSCSISTYNIKSVSVDNYKIGEKVATRDAFGKILVKLGKKNKNIVAVDGDVRNSTKMQEFFDKFPKRSFNSFIAEQNMVGMAMGLSALSFVPFVSTFATFFTRAHDFLRMAQYSKVNLNIVGSHTGVSIGEDGPSQMGLEDISMFISMPDSIILNPCDAVSAQKCTIEMAKHKGLVYLRTIRGKTPVIYKNNERFKIGGLKVVKKSSKDKVLVIGYGVTVFEALKAYSKLKEKKINIRVIDLYSIKPVDKKALLKNAKECKNKVILVEDHYKGGAICTVSEVLGKINHLCVNGLPRSGKEEELRKMFKIDSNAIIKDVMKIK